MIKLQKALPVHEIESTPGPKYSTIAPVPPLTVKIPATLRITSKNIQQNYNNNGQVIFKV